VEDEEKLR